MNQIGDSTLRIEWNDGAVKLKVREAIHAGLDATVIASVIRAKDDHAYMDETGHMQRSVRVQEWAHQSGPTTHTAKWGADANYALYLEIGTSRPWSGAPRAQDRARAAHGDMWAIPPPLPPGDHTGTRYRMVSGEIVKELGQGPLMEPRMSLRPAAAKEYPLLAARIRAAYFGETLA